MFLDKELQKLENLFPHADRHSKSISEKNVGWHIDHSLKTITVIINSLKQSDPSDYSRKFNLTRCIVHTTGHIPRGKGKAPESVQPSGEIKQEALELQLKEVSTGLKSLAKLPPRSNFRHPYFGMLNLRQARRFLAIHTRHHLKIIRDIMRQS